MRSIQLNKVKQVLQERTKLVFSAFILIFTLHSNAQRVSVNININSHPNHGHGHYEDSHHHENVVDYYYYPEIEVYFDVQSSMYIYYASNGWIKSRYLPRHCSNYNIQRGYRVVLDYHGNRPYNDFHHHKKRYKCKPYYQSCCEKRHKHKYHKKHRRNHDYDEDDD
uniref:hypothetical protein n=1 Tax=Flavobacterium sp. TaxID=239 RepID=UPI0040478CFE